MTRSTWALAIAGMSIAMHIFLTTYVGFSLAVLDAQTESKYELVQSFLIIYLILEIFMIICSILLVIGVKKGLHQYIPIWIFLSLLCTVMLCIVLIWKGSAVDVWFVFRIIGIVVQVGMLYPVFALWYNMRSKRLLQQQQSVQSAGSVNLNSSFCNLPYPSSVPAHPSQTQQQPESVTPTKQQFV